MWFKLASATFTNNLGTMSELSNSWPVSYSLSSGISKTSCPSSVAKNTVGTQAAADFIATFTLASGFTLNHIKAYVGGTEVASVTSGNSITISANKITGPVTIETSTTVVITPPPDDEEPETPVTPTNYTFTINPITPTSATVTLSATGYSTVSGTGSKSITVANGTVVNWSVSASGYTTQSGTWTANGKNESKSVKLVQPGEVSVIAETGALRTTGYYGSIPINGFAPSFPVSAMPDEISGVRFYINGVTAGDVKEMTALVGYLEGGEDGVPTVIKSVTKMVTLPAKNNWTTAADFPLHLTKEEVMTAISGKTDVALTIACYHSDVSEEGKAYTVGFANCTTDGLSATETSEYKGGYFYLGKWAKNSSKQHIYAAFLTGDVETTTHTITYKYMSGGKEVYPSTTETAYHNEIKKFTDPKLTGWNFVSVNMDYVAVTSDITVIYELARPEGNVVIAETGAKQSTGYHSSGVGINGFATSIDKSLLPADGVIKGVRAYLAGQTAGEVVKMTGCLGYSTAAPYTGGYTKNSVVWVKTVEQDVTMTAKSKFTQATDFMFDSGISVADFLAEVGDNTVYIGWYPTETTMQESKEHDIGSAYCSKDSASEVAMSADKALYHYLTGWSVNSQRQNVYAGILTNYND